MDSLFCNELKTRLTELTSDLRFWQRGSDKLIAPQVVETMAPPPEDIQWMDMALPQCCFTIVSGEFSVVPKPFKVRIDLTIESEKGDLTEAIEKGCNGIREFVLAIQPIVDKRFFTDYKLSLDPQYAPHFTIGNSSGGGMEGMQDHPYYRATIFLNFIPKK